MQRLRPLHFAQDGPLLVTDDGEVLRAAAVSRAVKEAAVAKGASAADADTHSLRAGGASAMWHAGYPPDRIQRRGRWLSECWKLYIWVSREDARDLGQRMTSQAYAVAATLHLVK